MEGMVAPLAVPKMAAVQPKEKMGSMYARLKLRVPVATYLLMLMLLYAIAASQAVWSFAYKWTTIADHPEYSLENIMDGSSPKPYAFRILVPDAINLVSSLIPEQVSGVLIERSRLMLEAVLGTHHAGMLNDRLALDYAMAMISAFMFLFLALILFRAISTLYFEKTPVSKVVQDFSPIAFALLLTISYRAHNGFIYDHFEIFIFSLYIYLKKRRKFLLSIAVLVMAIFNKETAIFFPVFGAVISWSEERKLAARDLGRILFESLVVMAGFVTVRIMLMEHPGSSTEWHLFTNLKFWFSWYPLFAITTPHFPLLPLPKPSNIIVSWALLLMVFGYWREKPREIRVLLFIAGFINIPLFILFCYQDEYRNLSLMFPFLYLATVHTSLHYFGAVVHADNGNNCSDG